MLDLGLQTHAGWHFGFLVLERGYERTVSCPFRVRFESATVVVELVFDGDRSYELGLLVVKGDACTQPFSIDEILRLRRAPDAALFSLIQVTTNEAMAMWVEKLAEAFRTHGGDFIAGNSASFAELDDQRSKDARTHALGHNVRAARADASAAWRRKDYASVVKSLKPLRAALTAAEVGKLEYAESQCRK